MELSESRVVIVGGGFLGVSCALALARMSSRIQITLVSNKEYFEYYPALYRVATGSSPLQACINLSDIFESYKNVEIIKDTVVHLDPESRTVRGEQGVYRGDFVVIGIGSENNFFNIQGVEELSFNFKTVHGSLRLKKRLYELFDMSTRSELDEQLLNLHFVIVGGGPSGVELAGELAGYTRRLAQHYHIDPSLITIDLVEGEGRVLARLPESIGKIAEDRLHDLGIHLYTHRRLLRDESWTVFLQDMKLGAKTVIWAAGVQNNHLFKALPRLPADTKGRIMVDEFLQISGYQNIFIGGDNAATMYTGMAQTALYDGKYIARMIMRSIKNKAKISYVPSPVWYDIPIGPGWAILAKGNFMITGKLAWLMRHMIDFRFYLSLLPMRKAIRAFFSGSTSHHDDEVLCEEVDTGNLTK